MAQTAPDAGIDGDVLLGEEDEGAAVAEPAIHPGKLWGTIWRGKRTVSMASFLPVRVTEAEHDSQTWPTGKDLDHVAAVLSDKEGRLQGRAHSRQQQRRKRGPPQQAAAGRPSGASSTGGAEGRGQAGAVSGAHELGPAASRRGQASAAAGAAGPSGAGIGGAQDRPGPQSMRKVGLRLSRYSAHSAVVSAGVPAISQLANAFETFDLMLPGQCSTAVCQSRAAMVRQRRLQAASFASLGAARKLCQCLHSCQAFPSCVQAWFCEACDCWVPSPSAMGRVQVWQAHVAGSRHRRQAAAAARTEAASPLQQAAPNQESTSYYCSAPLPHPAHVVDYRLAHVVAAFSTPTTPHAQHATVRQLQARQRLT